MEDMLFAIRKGRFQHTAMRQVILQYPSMLLMTQIRDGFRQYMMNGLVQCPFVGAKIIEYPLVGIDQFFVLVDDPAQAGGMIHKRGEQGLSLFTKILQFFLFGYVGDRRDYKRGHG